MGHLGTTQPLGDQKHPVQTVIIARLRRASDLVLQAQDNGLGIFNCKRLHAAIRSRLLYIRNYL